MPKEELRCEICGKICSSRDVLIHWRCTGHNSWTLILPGEERELCPKCGEDITDWQEVFGEVHKC